MLYSQKGDSKIQAELGSTSSPVLRLLYRNHFHSLVSSWIINLNQAPLRQTFLSGQLPRWPHRRLPLPVSSVLLALSSSHMCWEGWLLMGGSCPDQLSGPQAPSHSAMPSPFPSLTPDFLLCFPWCWGSALPVRTLHRLLSLDSSWNWTENRCYLLCSFVLFSFTWFDSI